MIGPKNKGLSSIFTMMNLERIIVGLQGLGLSEIAYQNALNYSKERKQGKSNNSKTQNGADLIIDHADIRRSLLNMKSIIEGERALSFWLAQQTEVSLHHSDNKIKQEASDFVSLMTPVVKSLFTDMGMEITSDAMQIFGGYGYTKDQGIEQLYRDNRITPIYEGTNSVQAIDLVFRKLVNKNGNVVNRYVKFIEEEIKKNKGEKQIKEFAEKLEYYLKILINFNLWIEKNMEKSKDDINAACNDYLKVLGLVAVAFSWLKILNVSYKELKNNKKFYEDKIETAKFFFNRVLPRIDAYYNSAISGSKYIMDFKFN
jgi:hypothetical protein